MDTLPTYASIMGAFDAVDTALLKLVTAIRASALPAARKSAYRIAALSAIQDGTSAERQLAALEQVQQDLDEEVDGAV